MENNASKIGTELKMDDLILAYKCYKFLEKFTFNIDQLCSH